MALILLSRHGNCVWDLPSSVVVPAGFRPPEGDRSVPASSQASSAQQDSTPQSQGDDGALEWWRYDGRDKETAGARTR